MSLAPDVPPIVNIPLRARRTGGVPGDPAAYRHLSLVAVPVLDLDSDFDSHVDSNFGFGAAVAVSERAEPSRAVATIRLTRRGQWAAGLSVAVAGGLMLLVAHLSAGSAAATAATPAIQQVTVRSGDTLWSIAHEVAPGRDPRAVVDKLTSQNHLTSVSLTPGQVLRVG
ncbi:MAG TPA: LysM peptidoglycan-binding domain-containing protein [Jatrophihabitans sp.]|jgi:hypothetical protein